MDIIGKIGSTVSSVEIPDFNFNHSDINRDEFMLKGGLASEGYDWWWHSFTAHHATTGEEKAFFIEFFTINPALGKDEPVLGQLPANKEAGIKPSYMMVKAGHWGENARQLHKFFGWNSVNIKQDAPFQISAQNCFLSETRTFGKIDISEEEAKEHPEWMCSAGRMVWDLTIDKKVTFNVGYGASWPLREIEAFQMFWHAEGIKTEFSGKIYLDDEEYIVDKDTCFGYADKNWGKDFTSPWVWLSSNRIRSKITGEWLEDTVFDIGGGRPKVGPVALERKLLGAMLYKGETYEYNFSKFWTLTRTKFKCKEHKDRLTWKVIQETPLSKMETEITCYKKDMLLVNYESPDGAHRHDRLWNGGNGFGTVKLYKKSLKVMPDRENKLPKWKWNLVDDMEVFNVGCEYGEYKLTAEEIKNEGKEDN